MDKSSFYHILNHYFNDFYLKLHNLTAIKIIDINQNIMVKTSFIPNSYFNGKNSQFLIVYQINVLMKIELVIYKYKT